MNKCCKKCKTWDGLSGEPVYQCSIRGCECHSQEKEEDFYCKHCGGCGEVACDGIKSFLEKHVRGNTQCRYEDSYIDDFLLAYESLEKPEETTTSQAILLDIYEREGLVGIEKHIAKERTQAEKKLLNQVLDIIHETDPSTGRGTSKIYWGNVLREKVSALLPEQESK